ncbi:hypothetical protein CAOG_01520 [Capsaspora owczarzaki ATCC 30864]|uniref:Uncharacterized protein n=1 Tax=Capsaspora owczarzaki (strain ATCC 30864) TaxID=595528 RepID=A0A0D2WJG4_CAPO3|nr:hypothetical protein CAOG_01520 [Capsaspora owczarzaki ATCC 30864]KJE90175.1 hypothetical protein CAOG_001520 [Capsaspora owczarzaki ATCC 30864]|eukprot:XP_004364388.2 hypothetical protein CAOG_01520 [Capsaspora owczarzaki ATCC 30864]
MPTYEAMFMMRQCKKHDIMSLCAQLFATVHKDGGSVLSFKHFGLELLPYRMRGLGSSHLTARRFTINMHVSTLAVPVLESWLKAHQSVARYQLFRTPDLWKQQKRRACARVASGDPIKDLTPVSTLPVPLVRTAGGGGRLNLVRSMVPAARLSGEKQEFFYPPDRATVEATAQQVFSSTGSMIVEDFVKSLGFDRAAFSEELARAVNEADPSESPVSSTDALQQLRAHVLTVNELVSRQSNSAGVHLNVPRNILPPRQAAMDLFADNNDIQAVGTDAPQPVSTSSGMTPLVFLVQNAASMTVPELRRFLRARFEEAFKLQTSAQLAKVDTAVPSGSDASVDLDALLLSLTPSSDTPSSSTADDAEPVATSASQSKWIDAAWTKVRNDIADLESEFESSASYERVQKIVDRLRRSKEEADV